MLQSLWAAERDLSLKMLSCKTMHPFVWERLWTNSGCLKSAEIDNLALFNIDIDVTLSICSLGTSWESIHIPNPPPSLQSWLGFPPRFLFCLQCFCSDYRTSPWYHPLWAEAKGAGSWEGFAWLTLVKFARKQQLLAAYFSGCRIFSSAEGTTQAARVAQKKELHEARRDRGLLQHSLPLTPR